MDGPTDRLCDSCRPLVDRYLYEPEAEIEHETARFSALETSAQNGCPLCGIIVAGIVGGRTLVPLRDRRTDPSPVKLKVPRRTPTSNSHPDSWRILANGASLGWVIMRITQTPVEEALPHKDMLQDTYELQWELENLVRTRAARALKYIDEPRSLRKICDLTIDTGQQEMAERVKQWLEACHTHHAQCGALQDLHMGLPPLPTRVLDVGTLQQPSLRLHVSKDGEREKYACLSYCWGSGVVQFKTTTRTWEGLQNDIPFSELPKTIQDAIVFTRRLQIPFLWVDALCIIQDDTSNPSDWQREAAQFGTYYQNALCTLAATGSHDSSEGLFLESLDRVYPTHLSKRVHQDSKEQLYYTWIPKVHSPSELVSAAPLSRRGWAAQEKILSPRIVHFTRRYVLWECTKLFASERSPDLGVPTGSFEPFGPIRCGFSKHGIRAWDQTYGWGELSKWYTRLEFTRPSDRLPALSAVAKRIQRYKETGFHFGLWEDDIVGGLDWFVQDPDSYPGPQTLFGPSWSWIHATGALNCRNMSSMSGPAGLAPISAAEPRNPKFQLKGTGHGIDDWTTSGAITLSGILSTLDLAGLGYKRDQDRKNRWVMDGDNYWTGIFWDRLPLEVEVHCTHICLQMGEFEDGSKRQTKPAFVKALILVLVSEHEKETPEYRRVGYGRIRKDVWDGGKPEWKDIKLV